MYAGLKACCCLQVAFNPLDNTQLCVVGNGLFKLFRYSEESLKQFGFQKHDQQNYLCQAWMLEDRMIVGTETGRLLLLESGELKTEFNLTKSDCVEERFMKFACFVVVGIFSFSG